MTEREKAIEMYQQVVRQEMNIIKQYSACETGSERVRIAAKRHDVWLKISTFEKILENVFGMTADEITTIYVNTAE